MVTRQREVEFTLLKYYCMKIPYICKNNIMSRLVRRITIDERICNGKPVIRGKRITVQTILEFLSAGDKTEDILKQYPSLDKEDIKACLKFAADLMKNSYSVSALS